MDPLFEIALEPAAKGARGLYDQIRAAILDGRLRPGARLPATRKSAAFFGVSRNTAVDAYDRLLSEGFIVARRGSGTYVTERPPLAPRVAPDPGGAPDKRLNPFWLRPDIVADIGFWRDEADSSTLPAGEPALDFRPRLVDSRLFPFELFRRASAAQLRRLERKPASYKSPQGNQGSYALRAAIVEHIGVTRAVVCRADDLIITSGAQQAFDLLARTLVTPGKSVVAIEDPGYPPMRVAFAAAGAKLAPVAIDAEGLVVDQIPPGAAVICVCPSHQFPLGVAMSARRRAALLAFARRTGAVIIEDDYDGEFRFDGGSLAALRTADAADQVCYVGTFSKCMLPALRLGFIVAPGWAVRTLTAAKNCLDWHCPTPVQAGVATFIAEGHLMRHVRKMREVYRARRALLLDRLGRDFGAWLAPVPSCYGMHVAAAARAALDFDAVAEGLAGRGVKLHSFSRYYLGAPAAEGVIFGYGVVDLGEIERGLALLRRALAG
ncbi:MAG TPA: PLP-dependent aminotransferase family protein [Acetobacteraceae bacterium]|nr:PLP-dependent aminotransferase family protein [Acetobacteraceae bacterium]